MKRNVKTRDLEVDDVEALYARWPSSNRKDIDKLRDTFKYFDRDGSGAIDIGELQYVLAAQMSPDKEAEDLANARLLWDMMEKIDTQMPYGSIGIEEWINYNLSKNTAIKSSEEWQSRMNQLFPSGAAEEGVVLHDREGFPTWLDESEFARRWTMGKKLGEGKYASVHLVTGAPGTDHAGEQRAMKIFLKTSQTKEKIYKIIKEAIYTKRAAHENVARIFDLIETKQRLLILFENVEGGELYKEVLRRKHFAESSASKVVMEMTAALAHMHEKHVIHCDLKPENVLCTHDPSRGDDWDIKITDFGLSKPVIDDDNHSDLTFCGSPLYMSPEMLNKHPYTDSVDMWSLGVMMFELLCGTPPFHTARDIDMLKRMVNNFTGFGVVTNYNVESDEAAMLLKKLEKANASEAAKDLLSKLLHPNGQKRISAAEALKHQWMQTAFESHGTVHLGGTMNRLNISVSKRKFRRAVNKIILKNKLQRGNTKFSKDGHELIYPKGLMNAVKEENHELAMQEICVAIDRGEHINGRNHNNQTALMMAIARRSTSIASQLICLKADPALVDNEGRTALMYAATNGDAGTARRLLEMNRKLVEDQDNAGNTAASLAGTAANPDLKLVLDQASRGELPALNAQQGNSTVPARHGSNTPAEQKEVCCGIS